MTKEEKELFLNFVDGKRKYSKSKKRVIKRTLKSKGEYIDVIFVHSLSKLESRREFPYPFIKEMEKDRYYTIDEVLNMFKEK
jgi:hypothetical protein